MKFLEKDLEQIICESDREHLSDRYCDVLGKLYRQLKIGNYGIADIVTFQRPVYLPKELRIRKGILNYITHTPPIITVYELKKDSIDIDAFIQAIKYAKGIKRYLEEKTSLNDTVYNDYFNAEDNCVGVKIKIVLIGNRLDLDENFIYLADIFEDDVTFLTYNYKIDGIHFKHESGYKLINEGF